MSMNTNQPLVNSETGLDSSSMSSIQRAIQLSEKDRMQLQFGFEHEAYEMATTFLWKKTLDSLKKQLGLIGMPFVSELLGKVGSDELVDYREIPDFDALRLAEELGLLTGPSAFRLKTAMDLVNYYASSNGDEIGETIEMNKAEAVTVLLACVNGVLSNERLEAALDFKGFRDDLEARTMGRDDEYIKKFSSMPYFYLRTAVSLLVSIIKKDSGAQLENALANANLIIPLIWDKLRLNERFLIGRCYADLYSDGKNTALSGVKKVLLKVKGFDYVPEDLRSRAFISAADQIIKVHYSFDNFYFEPAAISTLSKMGSVIPTPALFSCISAVLCVYLGNQHGISYAAQEPAMKIIDSISHDRWLFYLKNCLSSDDRILLKLMMNSPIERWTDLFSRIIEEGDLNMLGNSKVNKLMTATIEKEYQKIMFIAKSIYEEMGYSAR